MSEINIGQDIVTNAGEPTKTVEEMKELMGVDTVKEKQGEQATPTASDSSTTVKVQQPDLSSAFVVENSTATEPQQTQQSETVNDNVFDPAIHCVDEFGNPRKTKNGKYRRKPGRKGETAKEQVKATQYESFTCAAPVSTIAMVQMMIDNTTLVAAMMMGPEWKPSPDEKAMLTDAYARYIHYKGWDGAMSPEVFVLSITATYIMPRLMNSEFIKKLLGIGTPDAHVNSRPNGKRENNVSESNRSTNGTNGGNGNRIRPPSDPLGGTIEISSLHR